MGSAFGCLCLKAQAPCDAKTTLVRKQDDRPQAWSDPRVSSCQLNPCESLTNANSETCGQRFLLVFMMENIELYCRLKLESSRHALRVMFVFVTIGDGAAFFLTPFFFGWPELPSVAADQFG